MRSKKLGGGGGGGGHSLAVSTHSVSFRVTVACSAGRASPLLSAAATTCSPSSASKASNSTRAVPLSSRTSRMRAAYRDECNPSSSIFTSTESPSTSHRGRVIGTPSPWLPPSRPVCTASCSRASVTLLPLWLWPRGAGLRPHVCARCLPWQASQTGRSLDGVGAAAGSSRRPRKGGSLWAGGSMVLSWRVRHHSTAPGSAVKYGYRA
mmetsp:Transcript_9892/g.25503  ORF Transcript_9892/g.25503 Transcript_9892/m.25503 type:complete len:208 (-) Transcript_9892:223-846(-)